MPIYELECAKCGVVEEVYYSSYKTYQEDAEATIDHSQFGASCGGYMTMIWSLPANLQIGKPTIVFKDPKTGDAIVAVHPHQPTPEGYIKEEIKGSIERSKFEIQQNKLHHEKDEIYNLTAQMQRDEVRKANHDQVKAELNAIADSSDNPLATKELMKAALNRPARELKKRKTEFKLDVNHLDKSNL
jgi:hypothetical protein